MAGRKGCVDGRREGAFRQDLGEEGLVCDSEELEPGDRPEA